MLHTKHCKNRLQKPLKHSWTKLLIYLNCWYWICHFATLLPSGIKPSSLCFVGKLQFISWGWISEFYWRLLLEDWSQKCINIAHGLWLLILLEECYSNENLLRTTWRIWIRLKERSGFDSAFSNPYDSIYQDILRSDIWFGCKLSTKFSTLCVKRYGVIHKTLKGGKSCFQN